MKKTIIEKVIFSKKQIFECLSKIEPGELDNITISFSAKLGGRIGIIVDFSREDLIKLLIENNDVGFSDGSSIDLSYMDEIVTLSAEKKIDLS